MSENTQTAMFEILKRIQADVGDVKNRLEQVETIMRKMRRDNAGMLVMMRATAGDFDERVNEIQERVERLESRPD